MKAYLMALMIAAVAAGTAFAEEGEDGGQHCKGKSWGNDPGGKQAWGQRDEREGQDRNCGERQEWGQDKRGERPGGPMDPAMMEQMKADHKAIRELGDAARAVTNEAAKAEIVAQLRAKIGEVADRMQAHQEQRLAQAEEHLAALKAKIEESKANRDQLIDEQVQRVLSGERPPRPERFGDFPHAKGGRGGEGEYRDDDSGRRGHDRDMRGDDDEDEDRPAPPPPAEEGMPDEMAPPPAE